MVIMDYSIKIDKFEGPMDLLLHLIKESNIDIYDISINDITKQYMDYLNRMEELNINIASSYLVMAAELMEIKSKSLLPHSEEESSSEEEASRENLINRLIEYKKYKEICKTLRQRYEEYSKRTFKFPESIELPKQILEVEYTEEDIINSYKNLVQRNIDKKNEFSSNITKIAVSDEYSVTDKVREIYKELINKPNFIFGKMFSLKA